MVRTPRSPDSCVRLTRVPRFPSNRDWDHLAVVEKAFAVLDPFFPTTAHFVRIFSTIVLSDFEIRTSDLRLLRARAGMKTTVWCCLGKQITR